MGRHGADQDHFCGGGRMFDLHGVFLVVASKRSGFVDHAVDELRKEVVDQVHGRGGAADFGAVLFPCLGEKVGELGRAGAATTLGDGALGTSGFFPRGFWHFEGKGGKRV